MNIQIEGICKSNLKDFKIIRKDKHKISRRILEIKIILDLDYENEMVSYKKTEDSVSIKITKK